MAYCTKQQVRDATGMQNTTKIPDAYLDLKISYADGIVNSAIGRRYRLPISPVPDLVAYFSLEITVAVLFMDQYGENSADTDKGWQKRLDWLTAELEKIAKGETHLTDSSGDELPLRDSIRPSFYPTPASSEPTAVDSTAPKVGMNSNW